MRFKKHLIKIRQRKFFYWEKNKKAEEAVIFIHGFPGNHSGLVEFAGCFGKNHRMIIPDLPACGRSETLAGSHTLENYAGWLNDFMNSLQLKQAVIVGHSFGARVAFMFSAGYHKRVKKLVLVTPVVNKNSLVPLLGSLQYKILKILPRRFQKEWLNNKVYQKSCHAIMFKSASPARIKLITKRDRKEYSCLLPAVAIEVFNDFENLDLFSVAEEIAVPTLVIAGGKDEIAAPKSVQRLAEKIRPAEFRVMEDSGHLAPLESPRRTAGLILNWLAKNNF